MIDACSEKITQLLKIKEIQTDLNRQIDKFFLATKNSETNTADKIFLLSDIYKTKKKLVDSDELLPRIDDEEVDDLLNLPVNVITHEEVQNILLYIAPRSVNKKKLSKKELVFLYYADFALSNAPDRDEDEFMIDQILENRDAKTDLSILTGYPKENISTNEKEALSGNIKYHYGSLDLDDFDSVEGLILPEHITGSLRFGKIKTLGNLVLPKSVEGRVFLNQATLTHEERAQLTRDNPNLTFWFRNIY